MSPQETIEQFVGHWNSGDFEAMAAMCSNDIVWHNIPMEPISGLAAMRAAISGFMEPVESCDWEIHSIAENGNLVLTERTDAFQLKNGKRAELPVMGTFVLDGDGKIAQWRDYFDMAQFQSGFAA